MLGGGLSLECRDYAVFSGEALSGMPQDSMPEVPLTSKDHGNSMLIAGRNDFRVILRPAGLDGGANAGFGDRIDPIPEGEESVRRHNPALTAVACLVAGNHT